MENLSSEEIAALIEQMGDRFGEDETDCGCDEYSFEPVSEDGGSQMADKKIVIHVHTCDGYLEVLAFIEEYGYDGELEEQCDEPDVEELTLGELMELLFAYKHYMGV